MMMSRRKFVGWVTCSSRFALVLLSLLALGMNAAEAASAKPIAQAQKRGFKVIALITSDPNWLAKWQTSPETVPEFQGAGTLSAGDKVTLVAFFSGAKLVDGKASLVCDVTIRDVGKPPQKEPPHACYEGSLSGPGNAIYLTYLEIAMQVGPDDPPGLIAFDIGVTDVNRGVRVPVTVSVAVDPKGGTK